MEIAVEIAKKLLQINAIKLSPQNPFTWASGLKSPIYCDNRIILSYPEIRRFVIDSFVKKAVLFEPFNLVAGVATAGIAYGVLLAEKLNLPFVYVRSQAKAHGRKNQIEGALKGGERALVIEDLISTGGSCLQAVDALRDTGCEIAGVLAIFTYGFSEAAESFRDVHCPFDTLSNFDVLVRQAVENNFISASEMETLKNWNKNPQHWSKRASTLK